MKSCCLILILVMQIAWGGQMHATELIEAVTDTAFSIKQKKNLVVEAKEKFGDYSNQYVDALRALVEEYDSHKMWNPSFYYTQKIYDIVTKTHYREPQSALNLAKGFCMVGNQRLDLDYYEKALLYIDKAFVGTDEVGIHNLEVVYWQATILYNIWICRGGSTRLPIENIYPHSDNVLLKEPQELSTKADSLANTKKPDYKKALDLEIEAKEYILRICGEQSLEYAQSLNLISIYLYRLAQYDNAITNVLKAINTIAHLVLNDREDYFLRGRYVQYIKNLCNYIANKGSTYKGWSMRIMENASKIYHTIFDNKLFYYALILNDLSMTYSNAEDHKSAIDTQKKSLSVLEDCHAQNTNYYANALMNLGVFYGNAKDWDSAYDWFSKSLECCRNLYGDNFEMYREALYNMSACCWQKGNIGELNYYTTLTNTLTSDLIKQTFSTLTAEDRSTFWDRYKGWFEISVHKYPFLFPTDSLCCIGYNGVLLSKGLLLHTEMEFAKLIYESGDIEVKAMYDDLKSTRQKINKLLEKPISERSTDIDSLKRLEQVKEDALKERSKVYGNYAKNLVITWEQVQEKLGAKDLAVEFVSFPLNPDSTMYIAYVLKKGWECPKMIKLFEEKELKSILDKREYMYRTDTISRLVWKPLDDVMQGVENIYFAPSGELYNVAIESVPTHEDGGKTLISEHVRNYYRLSSTRELALRKDKSGWHEAVVYGGLDYGMSVDGMARDASKYPRARGNSAMTDFDSVEEGLDRFNPNALDTLRSLPGTLNEAKAITRDLELQSVKTQQFTDSFGTETSFKDLDGRKKNIIHIGTHGFFNDRKKEYRNDELQLLSTNLQSKVVEDDALTRSGLYFAGANNVRLNGYKAIPDSIDDGILKASEIAQLDLRGLDMVVLSACRTGLGEITGDGVFGLQRGFKKAGAQTIIMSLWEVGDKATEDFMTEFFKNIEIDGEKHPTNKHEAFKKAQDILRANKDKYPKAPDCWAAFIMLDGI